VTANPTTPPSLIFNALVTAPSPAPFYRFYPFLPYLPSIRGFRIRSPLPPLAAPPPVKVIDSVIPLRPFAPLIKRSQFLDSVRIALDRSFSGGFVDLSRSPSPFSWPPTPVFEAIAAVAADFGLQDLSIITWVPPLVLLMMLCFDMILLGFRVYLWGMGDGGLLAVATMKVEQSCVENKQSAAASSSSLSEGSYGLSRMSPAVSSPRTSSPSKRFVEFQFGCLLSYCLKRISGPIRRAKGGWTPQEDETLRKAVEAYKGRSWKKIVPKPEAHGGPKDIANSDSGRSLRSSSDGSDIITRAFSGSASSMDSGLPAEPCKLEDQKNWLALSTVKDSNREALANLTVRGVNDSDTGCSMRDPMSDVWPRSDPRTELAECSNTGENDQLDDTSQPALPSESPHALDSLFYKLPQVEDGCLSAASTLLTTYDSMQQSYCSAVVTSPSGYLTPSSVTGKNPVQSVESILKSAARSFPNTPSIFRRRKRETETSHASGSSPSQSDRIKFIDSSDTAEGKIRHNSEATNSSLSKFNSSPCDRGAILLYNGKSFNESPPYRLRSKRTTIIKSVEKQLDFTLEENDCNGNVIPQSLAMHSSSHSSSTIIPSIQERELTEHPIVL
ncbi:hypothetical protein BHE74_00029294, partial [Ensete ventricosum]